MTTGKRVPMLLSPTGRSGYFPVGLADMPFGMPPRASAPNDFKHLRRSIESTAIPVPFFIICSLRSKTIDSRTVLCGNYISRGVAGTRGPIRPRQSTLPVFAYLYPDCNPFWRALKGSGLRQAMDFAMRDWRLGERMGASLGAALRRHWRLAGGSALLFAAAAVAAVLLTGFHGSRLAAVVV